MPVQTIRILSFAFEINGLGSTRKGQMDIKSVASRCYQSTGYSSMPNTLPDHQSPADWLGANWPRFVVKPDDLPTWERGDHTAPQLSGVYFLWGADGGLEYVGQSVDTHYRMNQHVWSGAIPFTAYSVLAVECPEHVFEFALPCFEAHYIKALMPRFNKRWQPCRLSPAKGMDAAIAEAWKSALAA